jgi:hypothetical protein
VKPLFLKTKEFPSGNPSALLLMLSALQQFNGSAMDG